MEMLVAWLILLGLLALLWVQVWTTRTRTDQRFDRLERTLAEHEATRKRRHETVMGLIASRRRP